MNVANILYTIAEPKTPGESEPLMRWLNTLSIVSALCIQFGMVFFSLSIFIGALTDTRFSEGVKGNGSCIRIWNFGSRYNVYNCSYILLTQMSSRFARNYWSCPLY